MKFILCKKCQDVTKLVDIPRQCQCGKSGGHCADGTNAEIWGECIPLGLDNRTLKFALGCLNLDSNAAYLRNFKAFLIKESDCTTIKRIDPV